MQDTCLSLHPSFHPNGYLTGDVSQTSAKRSFIMAVTRNGHMSEPVMMYAMHTAQRLGCAVLTVHVDTLPAYNLRRRSRRFAEAVEESIAQFRENVKDSGLIVEHLCESGRVGDVVSRLCRAHRRIEFVVLDKGIRLEEVARQSPVPVFPVLCNQQGSFHTALSLPAMKKGGFTMSVNRKRHMKNCMLFGTLTAALYATIFTYQDLVVTYFSKGGVFALLPVATVLAVSYFHGNFTSSFWSAMGIEASKKETAKKVTPAHAVVDSITRVHRPDTRPRVQMNA
jgi:hypothetical protein